MSTTTVETGWSTLAACASADPDLFFPDSDTPAQQIAVAKQICAVCLVRKACLEDAVRRGESEAICGGLTGKERRALVSQEGKRLRRPGKASARQLAVKHGAHLLVSLVKWRMSTQQVAEELGSTPMSVYLAYLLLVPSSPGRVRNKRPSVLEGLVHTSLETIRYLERRGLSHAQMGDALGVPQSMVSAALAVVRQREEAIHQLSEDGADGLARLQTEELRVLRECGAGLSVSDVIALEGDAIVRMYRNGSGMTLRDIAERLGFCRETVRRAYQEMKAKQFVKDLEQTDMEEAA
jgi:WhiB family redox-sensing transcriptional regulator